MYRVKRGDKLDIREILTTNIKEWDEKSKIVIYLDDEIENLEGFADYMEFAEEEILSEGYFLGFNTPHMLLEVIEHQSNEDILKHLVFVLDQNLSCEISGIDVLVKLVEKIDCHKRFPAVMWTGNAPDIPKSISHDIAIENKLFGYTKLGTTLITILENDSWK